MTSVSKFTPKNRREKRVLSDSEKKQDPVKVFCRLKALKDDEESTCIKLLSPTVLSLKTPPQSKAIHKEVQCEFKYIFTGYSGQKEIFEQVAYPLLEDLLKGKNGLLFTYGITGSGKTYTLTGDQSNPGIMPKCIHTLFNTISDHQAPKHIIKSDKMNGFEISDSDIQLEKTVLRTPLRANKLNKDITYINDTIKTISINENNFYSVFISYVEIYNNSVFDLLDETDGNGRNLQAKIVREDAQKNMYVNGVAETEVKSAEEAFQLFNIGKRRKKMGNTLLNSVSSRSHSIFNIRVVQFQRSAEGQLMNPGSNLLKVAQLSLVDLAGSERTSRTQNTGQLLKEAGQINNSLSTLRACFEILRKNQMFGTNELVPYRRSRLTLLFKNYFEGQGNVSMIVCVNPSVADFEENLHVMNFAETTRDIKVTRPEPKYTPLKKIMQKNSKVSKIIKNKNIPTILPKLPEIKLNFTSYDESQMTLSNFLNMLKIRAKKKQVLESEFESRITEFGKLIEDDDSVNILKTKHKNMRVENKLSDMEERNKELISQNKELQDNIDSLRNILTEKVNINVLEKENIERDMELQINFNAEFTWRSEQAEANAKQNNFQKMNEFSDTDLAPSNAEEKNTLFDESITTPPAAKRLRSLSADEVA